jgi:hypothetical protein
MKSFKQHLNEGSNIDKIISLAGDISKKEELRSTVDKYLNIERIPPINTKDPKEFEKKYNALLHSKKKDIQKIFRLDGKGVGKGEILTSYLNDYTKVNGAKSPYDLDFGSYKIEVKKFKYNKNGQMTDFGLHLKEIKGKIMNELNELFQVAKIFNPSLSRYNKSVSTGYYYVGLIKELRNFDPKTLDGNTKLFMNKNADMFTDKFIKIGNISDKETIQSLKMMAKDAKDIKSLEEIENDLVSYLRKNKDKYFMYNDDATLVFIDGWKSVTSYELYTIDANGVKFLVTP